MNENDPFHPQNKLQFYTAANALIDSGTCTMTRAGKLEALDLNAHWRVVTKAKKVEDAIAMTWPHFNVIYTHLTTIPERHMTPATSDLLESLSDLRNTYLEAGTIKD